MQYMIVALEAPEDFAARDDPGRAGEYWTAWQAYVEAIRESGLLVSAAALQPATAATTVTVADGRRHVQDGPYADTKEQLGGFFVIETEDLDVALDWAARCPSSAYAATEVRPVLPMRYPPPDA